MGGRDRDVELLNFLIIEAVRQPNRLHGTWQLHCTSSQKATREVCAKEKDHYGVTQSVAVRAGLGGSPCHRANECHPEDHLCGKDTRACCRGWLGRCFLRNLNAFGSKSSKQSYYQILFNCFLIRFDLIFSKRGREEKKRNIDV